MKKLVTVVGACAAALLLAACGNLSFDTNSSGSTSSTKTSSYTTTGTASDDTYQSVIEGGKYKVSKSRGLQLTENTQNDNTYNVRSMENGLVDLSKKQFSTTKYLFEEGQLLSTSTLENWLGRYSSSNKLGLNPEDNGKTGENDRNPMYLQTVLEQDYMLQSGSKLKLGGVSVALGMNSVDYYTKESYGAQYSTTIPTATLTAKGKEMASKVVARLRQKSSVGNSTPILIAIYKGNTQDALVGGTFVTYAVSKSGNSIASWNDVNEKNETLPVVNNKTPINSTVSNDFNTFESKVKSFFPKLAGVTAQAHYEKGQLQGLNIDVTTQFYGQTEINSFTQYVVTAASKYLPSDAEIQINIKSVQQMEAFAERKSGSKSFYTHVFSSY
ncbi:CamS family sex pheromone protein [Lacticaseibacillus pantheris]|nr:CamS family sex pheromone protein [Lacticaseibacillus pantheris]WKF84789.1 CamS family sex pheromone protein [Lacticaseibacillus pantheris]